MKGQASLNPNIDTVDDLVGRRKVLHLGMCNLLRDDLTHLADEDLEVCIPNFYSQVG